MGFDTRVNNRIQQAERELGGVLPVTWDIGAYSHFRKKRGFGVTFLHEGNDGPSAHMRFSEKLLRSPRHRQDGILIHEIGHVVDHVYPERALNAWASHRGVQLPPTAELRADAIALALYGVPVRYDSQTVQSTKRGSPRRPRHLGA